MCMLYVFVLELRTKAAHTVQTRLYNQPEGAHMCCTCMPTSAQSSRAASGAGAITMRGAYVSMRPTCMVPTIRLQVTPKFRAATISGNCRLALRPYDSCTIIPVRRLALSAQDSLMESTRTGDRTPAMTISSTSTRNKCPAMLSFMQWLPSLRRLLYS